MIRIFEPSSSSKFESKLRSIVNIHHFIYFYKRGGLYFALYKSVCLDARG